MIDYKLRLDTEEEFKNKLIEMKEVHDADETSRPLKYPCLVSFYLRPDEQLDVNFLYKEDIDALSKRLSDG